MQHSIVTVSSVTLPVHSFQTLLQDLATVAKNRLQPQAASAPAFDVITQPTALQQRAFDLLAVSLRLQPVITTQR